MHGICFIGSAKRDMFRRDGQDATSSSGTAIFGMAATSCMPAARFLRTSFRRARCHAVHVQVLERGATPWGQNLHGWKADPLGRYCDQYASEERVWYALTKHSATCVANVNGWMQTTEHGLLPMVRARYPISNKTKIHVQTSGWTALHLRLVTWQQYIMHFC